MQGARNHRCFVTVQGSDPPSEQRGCSNLAAMAAYRFREVTQHVTLLPLAGLGDRDRKSTRLNSSHGYISYAVFCLKKKKNHKLVDIHQPQLTMLTLINHSIQQQTQY